MSPAGTSSHEQGYRWACCTCKSLEVSVQPLQRFVCLFTQSGRSRPLKYSEPNTCNSSLLPCIVPLALMPPCRGAEM